jgi:two-component system nitrogen regulation response regulator NtrX
VAGEHILVVDDEPAIQKALRDVLEDEGYRVSVAGSGAEALKAVGDEAPDLVFLDIWMPRMDGLETLAELRRLRPDATVVVISGHGTIETAVKATRLGAWDFIEKPLSLEKTLVTVTRALEHGRLERENASLRARLDQRTEIIGDSGPMDEHPLRDVHFQPGRRGSADLDRPDDVRQLPRHRRRRASPRRQRQHQGHQRAGFGARAE